MASKLIQSERIRTLNDNPRRAGDYVLYWMQSAVRSMDNHALEYASQQANDAGLPLLVCFGLWADYPEANARHFHFLLEGLQDVESNLKQRDIKFVVQKGEPFGVVEKLTQDAAMVVVDRNYLCHHKRWYRQLEAVDCRVAQVETDVVVPVETVSNKREYAARTIRPKIHKHLDQFLVELTTTPAEKSSLNLNIDSIDLSDIPAIIDELDVDDSVPPVSHLFKGGENAAKATLRRFLANRFHDYDDHRNQPQTDDVSYMSMYLHYGHISPLYIALQIKASQVGGENEVSYIEELIVRRELPMNFCFYEEDYDKYSALPAWPKKTLAEHRDDVRPIRYTRAEMESAETHDDFWNAAMCEMIHTGYMHNYMRMYWGKKILEWCNTPEYAHETLLYFNNKYFLDGRDANSFSNALWIFGLHDRPWKEREIFGKVRYMSYDGLKRKAKMPAYIKKVNRLVQMAKT